MRNTTRSTSVSQAPLSSSRTQLGRRAGAAVVEFAFVAPFMIFLTMGMIEIGRLVMVKQMLVSTSREGARMAVLPGSKTLELQSYVESELEKLSINTATVTLTPAILETAAPGSPITVQISVPAANVSWIPQPMFSFGNLVEAATTMRKESQ